MQLLRNKLKITYDQLVFHVNMKLQTSVLSILVSIFRIGLLPLSAGTYCCAAVLLSGLGALRMPTKVIS